MSRKRRNLFYKRLQLCALLSLFKNKQKILDEGESGKRFVPISEKKSRGGENIRESYLYCTRMQEEEQMGLIGHK